MTRTAWTFAFVVGLVLFAARPAAAQPQKDTRTWIAVQGEAEFTDRLQLVVEQEVRLGSVAGFDETHTDLELGFRLSPNFAVAGHYRLILKDGDGPDPNETRHRVAGDFTARIRPKPVTVSWRTRVQRTSRETKEALVAWRNKLKVAVAAPAKLEPYAAVEAQYLLSPNAEYRETRYFVGVDWKAAKRLDLGLYYLYLTETNVGAPEELHVLGVCVTYTFLDAAGKPAEAAAPVERGD